MLGLAAGCDHNFGPNAITTSDPMSIAGVDRDSMLWWQMAGAWWQMAGTCGDLVGCGLRVPLQAGNPGRQALMFDGWVRFFRGLLARNAQNRSPEGCGGSRTGRTPRAKHRKSSSRRGRDQRGSAASQPGWRNARGLPNPQSTLIDACERCLNTALPFVPRGVAGLKTPAAKSPATPFVKLQALILDGWFRWTAAKFSKGCKVNIFREPLIVMLDEG